MDKLIDLARNIAGLDDSALQSADVSFLRSTLTEFRGAARDCINDPAHEFIVTRTSNGFRCAICDKPRSDHYFAA